MATGKAENHEIKTDDLFNVRHVSAVVTGGHTGIGLMIAQALVANGARVYITGRREDKLENAIEKYNTGPGKMELLVGDVSKKEECIRLAKEVTQKEMRGIQLLVNNAGIARDDNTKFSSNGRPDVNSADSISQHFLRSEEQQWLDTFHTNVTGQYFMSMAFLPLLAKGTDQTPGYSSSIVNVSSISGSMKGSSNGQFAYASSKAAFTHLGRMLATTFKDVKVRVNTIAPGVFPSEMTTGSSGEDNKSQLDMQMSNPAGRPGHDTDMAATILFLAGKGGVFYNDQVLYPDGVTSFLIRRLNLHTQTQRNLHHQPTNQPIITSEATVALMPGSMEALFVKSIFNTILRWFAPSPTAPQAPLAHYTTTTTTSALETRRATRAAFSADATVASAAGSRYTGAPATRFAQEAIKSDLWVAIEWLCNWILPPALLLWLAHGTVNWRAWFWETVGELPLASVGEVVLAVITFVLLLPFRLLGATAAGVLALTTRFRLRDHLAFFSRWLDSVSLALRYNPVVDTLYLHYQETRNWLGRYKLWILACGVLLYHLSKQDQSVSAYESAGLVEWAEVDRQVVVPEMFWRHRALHLGLDPRGC
ncbi:uncharacterized protein LTR77_001211 [Saxophila tyrrhenica]|uniref:NAD(P)-binding protein n=1 Tax=Saxophila tyrrhenica TaxID=1690608 RepID=A0AAV9PMX6_9PEZI|nr:hypothetical protein LTR77_001211 [Saxophila tyrrhenica]